MISAYKFLERGSIGRFSEFAWPKPSGDQPAAWVESSGMLAECRDGVHACRLDHLVDWIDDELWEVELDGEIVEQGEMVVAERGRLARRIEGWDEAAAQAFADECALRARMHALGALRRVGLTDEAQRLVSAVELNDVQAAAVAVHESVDDPAAVELAGFAADAVSLAGGQRPEAWRADAAGLPSVPPQNAGATAANLAFVVAHAAGREAATAAPGDPSAYGAGFSAERAWQRGWLVERLGLPES